MTIGQWIQEAESKLQSVYESSEVRSILRYWLKERIRLQPHEWSIRRNEPLPEPAMLQSDLQELITAKPIQYVLGYEWFDGMQLQVSEAVLIPRPETEELVHWIASIEKPTAVIADLCTGSGCIALALQKRFPEATVTGWDLSSAALEIARKNAARLQLPVSFWQANVLESFSHFPELANTQVLVSNPPYVLTTEASQIHANVLSFEPHLALFVPADDAVIFYRNILQEANLLSSVQSIYFELNPDTAEEVAQIGQALHWKYTFRSDFQQKTRMIRFFREE